MNKVFKTQRGMYSQSVSSLSSFDIVIELLQVEIVRNICVSFLLGLYRSMHSAINMFSKPLPLSVMLGKATSQKQT